MEQHTENSQNKEISGYTPTTKELLFEEVGRLHDLVIKNEEAQYKAAQRDDNSHRWIGISNIALTVIVGA